MTARVVDAPRVTVTRLPGRAAVRVGVVSVVVRPRAAMVTTVLLALATGHPASHTK